jgi:hypothetical protein
MIATRKTLVDAKSQHLPDERWFVTGDPSNGIRVLKFCVSDITDARFVRTAGRELEERADMARRF